MSTRDAGCFDEDFRDRNEMHHFGATLLTHLLSGKYIEMYSIGKVVRIAHEELVCLEAWETLK